MSVGGASMYPIHIISPDSPASGSPPSSPSMADERSNDRKHFTSLGVIDVSDTPSGKWVCQTCTYSNWPNVNQCIICRTVRRTRPFHTQGTSWQRTTEASRVPQPSDSIFDYVSHVGAVGGAVHFIGAENLPSVHSRDSLVQPSRPKGGRNGNKAASNVENRAAKKWKCAHCTYQNWPKATKCVLCYHPRKRTPSPPLSQPQMVDVSPQAPTHASTPSQISSSLFLTQHRGNDRSSPTNSVANSNEASATVSPSAASPPSFSSPSSSTANTCSSSLRIPYASDDHPSPEIVASVKLKSQSDEVRQIRNQLSSSDWLFLNACLGVVNNDVGAVRAYLRQGGDRSRQLIKDECMVLGEPSKFTVGSTLVHLAIRYIYTCMHAFKELYNP